MRVAVLVVLAALAFPAGAFASPSIAYGIQDDAWLAQGPGALPDRVASLEPTRRRGRPVHDPLERGRGHARPLRLAHDGHRPGRAARPRHPAPPDALRHAGLGERLRTAERPAPERRRLRALRRRRGCAVPVGARLVDLERAEPDAVPAPGEPARLRHQTAEPGLSRDPRADPRRPGRGGRDRAAGEHRRPLAGRVDPWDARRRRAPRRLRPPSVPDLPQRDPLERRLRPLRDDHDGHARAAAPRGPARVAGEARLADGVRLPDEPARPVPRRLASGPGARISARARSARTAPRASTCSSTTSSATKPTSAASRAGSSPPPAPRSPRRRRFRCRWQPPRAAPSGGRCGRARARTRTGCSSSGRTEQPRGSAACAGRRPAVSSRPPSPGARSSASIPCAGGASACRCSSADALTEALRTHNGGRTTAA